MFIHTIRTSINMNVCAYAHVDRARAVAQKRWKEAVPVSEQMSSIEDDVAGAHVCVDTLRASTRARMPTSGRASMHTSVGTVSDAGTAISVMVA